MLSERMGRTLEELARTMTSEEFGLRMALELIRNPPLDDGPEELVWMG